MHNKKYMHKEFIRVNMCTYTMKHLQLVTNVCLNIFFLSRGRGAGWWRDALQDSKTQTKHKQQIKLTSSSESELFPFDPSLLLW